MSESSNKDRVNRLVDMVVEEVSLVDRAANKRRFLIVKRSEEMAEDLNMEGDEQVVSQKDNGDVPADSDTVENGDESTDSSEEEVGWSEEETSPIDEAMHALEQLGRAISMLSGHQPETLNDLGAKLRQVADMIGGAVVGNKPVAAETPKQPENDKNKPGENKSPIDILDTLRREITAINTRLNALMQKEVKVRPRAKEKEPAGVEQIAELTKAVSSLTRMFQSHQQRLIRMEKSYGLPNSLPSNESRQPEVFQGWPLDLNSSGF